MSNSVIEAEDLTVYYGRRRGIVGVDLDIVRGEVFGFLGPNGAGKTTTLRVLLDVLRPTRGYAAIFGMDIRKNGIEVRRRVGYVPSEMAFPTNRSGRDYLDMIDGLRGMKAESKYRRKLIARFDLDVGQKISTYSRGNRQKLALIGAMMHRPELLILDEPTNGLDPLVQQQVIETVREVRAEGRTVFFSSHILSEAQAVCDRVAIIKYGRIIATENIRKLLSNQFHRMTVTFAHHPNPDLYEDVRGLTVTKVKGLRYTFELEFGLNGFMREAIRYGIEDIETHPVSLEEKFLDYYKKGGGDND